MEKVQYEAPSTNVIEVEFEGLVCVSMAVSATMNGTFTEEDI